MPHIDLPAATSMSTATCRQKRFMLTWAHFRGPTQPPSSMTTASYMDTFFHHPQPDLPAAPAMSAAIYRGMHHANLGPLQGSSHPHGKQMPG